jgi:hypothetical protein
VDLVPSDAIHFRETREGKAIRVCEAGCTHFIDDLPEFLAQPLLPPGLGRILFDPAQAIRAEPGLTVAASWDQIRGIFGL